MARIPLSQIAFDAGTQIRAALNESVVAEYAERMTEGVAFPPVVLFHDGNQYYLADGFHRFMAARRNEFRDIEADVQPGTKTDALWFALGANKLHGLQLTQADKKHAVLLAIAAWPEKLQREIAEHVGCSPGLVSRYIAATCSADVLRGKQLAVQQKRETVRALVADGVKSDEIVKQVGVSPNTVSDIRAELGLSHVDKSREAVGQRRRDIRDMAERGFTTRQIAASVGIGEPAVADIAKTEGITIHADRVVGRARRHDSTRIVEQTVMDAENLTADVNLIEFASLDRASIPRWVDSLVASHKSLATFIRRLRQEQKNVEAA